MVLLSLLMPGCRLSSKEESGFRWQKPVPIPEQPDAAASKGFAGMVTGSAGSYFVLAGGANFPDTMPWNGGSKHYTSAIYLFHYENGTLKTVPCKIRLPHQLAYAASCQLPGGIFFGGGENKEGVKNACGQITVDSLSGTIRIDSLPPLPVPVTNASALFHNNAVYLLGGENSTGTLASVFRLELAPIATSWVQLPDMPLPASHSAAGILRQGSHDLIIVAGGRSKEKNRVSTFHDNTFLYRIKDRMWKTASPLPYPLAAGTAIQPDPQTFILLGGDQGIVYNKVEALILDSIAETDPVQKNKLSAARKKVQETHPGFSGEVLQYDITADTWHITGRLPFPCPVTTHAFIFRGIAILPLGEIRPGIRTPLIQWSYINSEAGYQ